MSEVDEIVSEAIDQIVEGYEELSRLLNVKLSSKWFESFMQEVVRLAINEVARELIHIKYPELDDLPENEYLVIDELVPALLEKYVMERLGLEGRSFEEIIDELEWVEEVGVKLDERRLKAIYEDMVRKIKEGKLELFIKELPKQLVRSS